MTISSILLAALHGRAVLLLLAQHHELRVEVLQLQLLVTRMVLLMACTVWKRVCVLGGVLFRVAEFSGRVGARVFLLFDFEVCQLGVVDKDCVDSLVRLLLGLQELTLLVALGIEDLDEIVLAERSCGLILIIFRFAVDLGSQIILVVH